MEQDRNNYTHIYIYKNNFISNTFSVTNVNNQIDSIQNTLCVNENTSTMSPTICCMSNTKTPEIKPIFDICYWILFLTYFG